MFRSCWENPESSIWSYFAVGFLHYCLVPVISPTVWKKKFTTDDIAQQHFFETLFPLFIILRRIFNFSMIPRVDQNINLAIIAIMYKWSNLASSRFPSIFVSYLCTSYRYFSKVSSEKKIVALKISIKTISFLLCCNFVTTRRTVHRFKYLL